jgi:hypothetical protein
MRQLAAAHVDCVVTTTRATIATPRSHGHLPCRSDLDETIEAKWRSVSAVSAPSDLRGRTAMKQHSDEIGAGGSACGGAIRTESTTAASASAASESASAPADAARSVASEAKQQTAQLAAEAKQQVESLITDQKRRTAERLGGLAGSLHEAADRFGTDDVSGLVGRYAHRAADQVESMSSYVRTAEFESFVRDTGQLARRRPELFIGAAFVAGLLAARFIKASSGNANVPRGYAARENVSRDTLTRGSVSGTNAARRTWGGGAGGPDAAMGGR